MEGAVTMMKWMIGCRSENDELIIETDLYIIPSAIRLKWGKKR